MLMAHNPNPNPNPNPHPNPNPNPNPNQVAAACHYVPGHKVNKPKFTPYSKSELEAVLARVTPAPAN